MNPYQLVNANVNLQKLNADIDDLALLERAQKLESLIHHIGREDAVTILEAVRALAIKSKTARIRNLRQGLVDAGVDIADNYIETRLSECRNAVLGAEEHQKGNGKVTPIWANSNNIAGLNLRSDTAN